MATSLQVVKGAVTPCEATVLPLPTGPSTNDEGPSNDTANGGEDEGPSLNTVTD